MLSKLNSLREKNEDGFTLIELLIVVVIIGILAAIAIPIFLNQQKAAIAGTVKSDVRNSVSNVATYLTKDAKNTDLAAKVTAGDIAVVSTDGNDIAVAGGWKDYIVVGTNDSFDNAPDVAAVTVATVGDLDGDDDVYVFNSATGDYTGFGAIA